MNTVFSHNAKRILYVVATSSLGGAEISLLGLLEHLERKSFEPLVVLPRRGLLFNRLTNLQVPAVLCTLNDGNRRHPLPFLKSVLRFVKLLKREKIDLVHVNICHSNRVVAVATRLTRIPQICHVRNIQTKESFRHFFIGLSPFLVTNSRATEQSYIKYMRPFQMSWVIYNGVDLAKFDIVSDGLRSELGIGANAYVIAQIGRIVPEKGIHLFIEALKLVIKQQQNVCAIIVGDTSLDGNYNYLQLLQQRVVESGLSQRVLFTGFVGDILKVYRAIDLLVQPSIAEPFGRTLIEAMAMGLPVICTKAGGAVEVVEDGVTGLLVPPGDPEALSQAILRIIQDHEGARQLGKTGRKRVENMFTIEGHARRVQEVYTSILKTISWRSR